MYSPVQVACDPFDGVEKESDLTPATGSMLVMTSRSAGVRPPNTQWTFHGGGGAGIE